MAPPTVTNLVPGVTGRNHPCGTLTRSTSSSDVAADVVAVPAVDVEGDRRRLLGQRDHQPAAVLGAVAVAAPETSGDDPAGTASGEDAAQTVMIAGRPAQDGGGGGVRLTPAAQQFPVCAGVAAR